MRYRIAMEYDQRFGTSREVRASGSSGTGEVPEVAKAMAKSVYAARLEGNLQDLQ